MNCHIEEINDCLFAVNMGFINAGYIQELQPIDHSPGNISLTNQGAIIIDKASPLYPAMKRLLPELMEKRTGELQRMMQKYQASKMDALDDLIFNLCGWEIKRRSIRADYLKNHPVSIIDMIIKFCRKKVMKCQVFRQA